MEVVLSIKELYTETRAFLEGKAVSGGPESTPSPPTEGAMPSASTSGVAAGLGMVPVPHSWTHRRRRKRCMVP